MIIIETNAEQKLLEALENIKQKPFGWRLLDFNTDILTLEQRSYLKSQIVLRKIEKELEYNEAITFLCKDNDIVILTKELSKKQYQNLIKQLSEAIAFDKLKEISMIYDIEASWVVVQNMCLNKLEAIQQNKIEAEQLKTDAQNIEQQRILKNNPLDESLIRNIPKRKRKHKKPHILLVEDDAFSRRLVCNSLSDNFTIIEAVNGDEAIQSYIINAPNIVFLDIELPDLDGHKILEKILEIDPEAYVVMLSGNANKANIIKTTENGAKGFIGKPFSKEKLIEYINNCPA
jgi:two-component system chemotaxis response regulator CheY